MKKKLLLAACAFVSVASMSAYWVKIDNDTDGRQQATTVKAHLILKRIGEERFGRRFPSKIKEVPAGRERKIEVPKGTHAIAVRVVGIKGAGMGQQPDPYSIPTPDIGKDITVDVEFDKMSRKLYLKPDRKR